MSKSKDIIMFSWLERVEGNILDVHSNKVAVIGPRDGDLSGNNVVLQPIQKPTDLGWKLEILKYFSSENIHHVSACQTVMWPAVFNQLPVFCVGAPLQGKSLGWMFPVINNLSQEKGDENPID